MTPARDASGESFTLGVNYWPRRKAMYWWSDFDLGEVREEFDLIAGLGLTMVRLFLLWEDWQPAPDQVSPQALAHLAEVCDAAGERGLRLNITFFTGHMSGPSWVPQWMLEPGDPPGPWVRHVVSHGRPVGLGYRNPFTDPLVLKACELQLAAVVGRFRDHPAVAVWNLGNEPDLFAWPPDARTGREWVRRLTARIHELDPRHPVTCGLHVASLLVDNGLRVHEVFAEVDLPVMHAYPMYVDWAAGPLDPDFVPFVCTLTSALCGKAVLMEEFGGCTAPASAPSTYLEWISYGHARRVYMASEEELAEYYRRVIPRLIDVGATGALVWCFADYDPGLYRRPPCDESRHERTFGLVRPDGSLKPHAEVLRRVAASAPRVRPLPETNLLDLTPDAYYGDPLGNARRLYQAFRARKA